MKIRKSGYVESNWTCCCTGKFNMALSLYRVLEVTLYFSKGFLEAVAKASWPLEVTVGVLADAEALQLLGVTVVCFLVQESSLWLPAL